MKLFCDLKTTKTNITYTHYPIIIKYIKYEMPLLQQRSRMGREQRDLRQKLWR